VLLCSFFFDVALKLWKASSAGRSRAGWRRNWILRKKSKDQTQLNCKRGAEKKLDYFAVRRPKYLPYQWLAEYPDGCTRLQDLPSGPQKIHDLITG
jgi:hypothetical protein